MICAFCVFSILVTPAILIYKGGDGYAFGYQKLEGREIYSLGNLGYSTMQCAQIPVGIGILTMQCPYGTIGQIVDYGVNNVALGVNA